MPKLETSLLYDPRMTGMGFGLTVVLWGQLPRWHLMSPSFWCPRTCVIPTAWMWAEPDEYGKVMGSLSLSFFFSLFFEIRSQRTMTSALLVLFLFFSSPHSLLWKLASMWSVAPWRSPCGKYLREASNQYPGWKWGLSPTACEERTPANNVWVSFKMDPP